MRSLNERGARDLVLGAGGIKGFAHLGVLKALQELEIKPARIIGVSIGSAVATLYTNGFTIEQCRTILQEEMRKFDQGALDTLLRLFSPLQLKRRGGIINLYSLFQNLVDKYGLKPQPDLAVLAYDRQRRKPVLFEGSDYDLPAAVAGSCSVPVLMQATPYGKSYPPVMKLVDGAIYHPCPTEFCARPAIISRLGLARRSPREKLGWLERLLHMGEQLISPFWENRFKKPRKLDILIQSGRPNVATLSFGLRERTIVELEQYGYNAALVALKKAL